jgi:hypothetical protein
MQTLGELLDSTVKSYPDKIAVVFGDWRADLLLTALGREIGSWNLYPMASTSF